jgi:HAD superfamily hydrolase (TIGR01548 family)
MSSGSPTISGVARATRAESLPAERHRKMAHHPAPIDLPLDLNEAGGFLRWAEWLPGSISDGAIRRYPDLTLLTARLARLWKVEADRLVVTAGADEAIDRVCRCYLRPGQRAIIPTPTFQNLPRHARLAGAELVEPVWLQAAFPLDAVLAAIDASVGLIAVVSPNNPTGQIVTASQLSTLAERAGAIPVLVDLAYVEYDDEELLELALSLPNAIVVRTLSKSWGLAGLRIGGACGPRDWIEPLRTVGGTFSVAASSAAIALQVLESVERRADLAQARALGIAQVQSEREQLVTLAARVGVACERSRGNFVLWRTPQAGWLDDALRGLGISVRPIALPEGHDPALRITCPGDAGSFARLCAALETAIAPQALLFDLDGVLADVSHSYRLAIRQTAASFGVAIDSASIGEVKRAGGANNDWDLTHRLLTQHGLALSHDQVKTRFESIYQGSEQAPGLRHNERLLIERERWNAWSRRWPLAVVTGRTRRDAERFLSEHRLIDAVSTLVTLEDGPGKPDPAPIRTALTRLRVERAWMIGDNPDDARAARAAGVVALGRVAPGDDPEPTRHALLTAGAARIVETWDQLEQLLDSVGSAHGFEGPGKI